MAAPKQQPRLLRSGLSGRIYVVTRYRELDDDGNIEALRKFDVTEEFYVLAADAVLNGPGLLWVQQPAMLCPVNDNDCRCELAARCDVGLPGGAVPAGQQEVP